MSPTRIDVARPAVECYKSTTTTKAAINVPPSLMTSHDAGAETPPTKWRPGWDMTLGHEIKYKSFQFAITYRQKSIAEINCTTGSSLAVESNHSMADRSSITPWLADQPLPAALLWLVIQIIPQSFAAAAKNRYPRSPVGPPCVSWEVWVFTALSLYGIHKDTYCTYCTSVVGGLHHRMRDPFAIAGVLDVTQNSKWLSSN